MKEKILNLIESSNLKNLKKLIEQKISEDRAEESTTNDADNNQTENEEELADKD